MDLNYLVQSAFLGANCVFLVTFFKREMGKKKKTPFYCNIGYVSLELNLHQTTCAGQKAFWKSKGTEVAYGA